MTGPHDDETLDLPPPYTPTDTGESSNHSVNSNALSSAQQHQQLPPGYHTLLEQPGRLGESSSALSNSRPPTDSKQGPSYVERQSSSTSNNSSNSSNSAGVLRNISYNPSRGPIGNILDIAGNFVGNVAKEANHALGPPPSKNPEADYADQLARNAAIMANQASRYALEVIGGLLDGRNEKRGQRGERREMRRQGKQRESYDASLASSNNVPPPGKIPYQPYMPQQQQYGSSSNRTTSDVDMASTGGTLEIKQTNAPIKIKETWSGQTCRLKTSNGHLTVHGSLTATDNIYLETSNGNIVVDGTLLATKDINIKTSNGVFSLKGPSIIAKNVNISISNSPLQLNSILQAKTMIFKTKNAPVKLSQVAVGTELVVKTSNSPIELHVLDITSMNAEIVVESSNAPVHVYVPSTFAGKFSVNGGSANVVAKAVVDNGLIKYETDTDSRKTGTIKNLGTKANHEIHIKTSNAAAVLYI